MKWKERPGAKTTVNVIDSQIPKIYISSLAATKMKLIVDKSDKEVGWLCSVVEGEDNTYLIDEVYLFEQEVNGGTCEITAEGLTSFAMKLMEVEDGAKTWNRIRVWGHSHVDMEVFASAQDDDQMDLFGENKCEYFIRIISNKKGEMFVSFFDYTTATSYLNVPWMVLQSPECFELEKQIEELMNKQQALIDAEEALWKPIIDSEIDKKVSILKHTAKNWYKNGGWYDDDDYDYDDWYDRYNTLGKEGYTKADKKKSMTDVTIDLNELQIYFTDNEILEIGTMVNYWDAKRFMLEIFPQATVAWVAQAQIIAQDYYDDWLTKEILSKTNGE